MVVAHEWIVPMVVAHDWIVPSASSMLNLGVGFAHSPQVVAGVGTPTPDLPTQGFPFLASAITADKSGQAAELDLVRQRQRKPFCPNSWLQICD